MLKPVVIMTRRLWTQVRREAGLELRNLAAVGWAEQGTERGASAGPAGLLVHKDGLGRERRAAGRGCGQNPHGTNRSASLDPCLNGKHILELSKHCRKYKHTSRARRPPPHSQLDCGPTQSRGRLRPGPGQPEPDSQSPG